MNLWLLQGATNVTQSSDYFTLDRKDWAVLGPVYIWPGQRVRLTAPGEELPRVGLHRGQRLGDNYTYMDVKHSSHLYTS